MIIIKLVGGLGNQLFQYAAATALAQQLGSFIKVDSSSFQQDQLRSFELANFNLSIEHAAAEEISTLKAENQRQRIAALLTPHKKKKFYKQPYFHFDNRFFTLTDDIYLQGYFQSEKYFAPAQNKIRNSFTINASLLSNVTSLAQQLRLEPSVALHIRRGDYKDPQVAKIHGILPTEYYKKAINHIQQKLPHHTFYIFSDDSSWVANNLELPNAIIVSGRLSKTHFEDLHLMSCCQHNIIANSSFSWWGAWLNNNPRKIVIAPKNWFNDGPKDVQDLLPPSWLQLQ